jgi:Concanavalin A-like lectin/glucanases superfamily
VTRSGRLLAAIGVVVLLGAAVGVVVWEPWHGPVILSLSTGHGIDAGDLPVVLLVGLAVYIGRVGSLRVRPAGDSTVTESSWRWVGPTSAIVLGVVLLVAATVDLTDRGPLVPAGGGTFDGTVQYVAGRSGTPVRVWSYVALTYDGATLRLFVNGTRVSSRAMTGTIQATANPLWFGGNHPYGEYFEGVIDEARVYNRALGEAEIRADMETPVTALSRARDSAKAPGAPTAPTPAAGLVGAYSFDTGSGISVTDDSGNGNVGTITGATWTTRGRYGNALSFDGAGDVVRVPASASLDVGSALTLSAWVRPTALQSGWRTIVYRERDTFFLDAGSDLKGLVGRVDDLLAASVVAAVAWFSVVMVRSRGRWVGQRRRAWWVAAGMLLVGCVVDAAFAPSATLVGPALLAAWFAASARDRAEAVSGWLVAIGLTAATVASLADLAGFGIRMQRDDGGFARSAALGVTLFVIGLVILRNDTRSQVE